MAKDPYASLKQGLVGAWIPSVSGSGLLLPDLSGRGSNGALTNMGPEDWVNSGTGRALDFDGSNDYVDTNNTTFSLSNKQTISCFLYVRSTSGSFIRGAIAKGATADLTGFSLGEFNNKFSFWVNGIQVQPSANYALNKWYHVSATYDNSALALYVDGIQATTGTATYQTNSAPVLIGDWQRDGVVNSRYFDGLVDDARLYNRALSDSEIRILASDRGIGFKRKRSAFSTRYTYNPPKAKVYHTIKVRERDHKNLREGLVGAWCPSLSGSGNLLPDVSGRNNHGTLTNMGPEDWVSSQGGRALDFDGVNDWVSADVLPNAEEITVAGWYSYAGVPAGNNGIILAKGSLNGDSTSTFALYYNRLQGWSFFVVDANNNLTIVRSLTLGESSRHIHVAGVSSKQKVSLYVNGIEVTSTSGTTVKSSTHATYIGGGLGIPSNYVTNGSLDDIRIYNRALTDPEIRLLASRRGIGLQHLSRRSYAKEKKTGLRRLLLTGQT